MATQQPITNLMKGSTGPEVSQLQQTLKQHGLYQGALDGVYGTQTMNAVKAFQQMAGIKPDGIYGPQSTATLDKWVQNPIKFTIADPRIQQRMQQNPLFAQTMQQLGSNGGNQAAMVAAMHQMAAGGHTEFITPEGQLNGDVFQQLAEQYASPNINQSLKFYNNDFQSALNHEKTQYQNQLEQMGQDFGDTQRGMETKFGQQGNWDSGLANIERGNAVNTQNRNISNLQNNTQYTLSGLARNFENKLGSSAVNQYDFNAPNGSASWSGGYQQNGNKNFYTPMGGQGGTLRAQYASQINANANQLRAGSLPQVPGYNQNLAASVLGGSPTNYPY